jgi:hypothetical protein
MGSARQAAAFGEGQHVVHIIAQRVDRHHAVFLGCEDVV